MMQPETVAPWRVRWLLSCRSDIRESVQILRECFPAEEWTQDDLANFRGRSRHVAKVVVAADDHIAGVVLYQTGPEIFRLRRLAVTGMHRRQGVGAAAMHELLSNWTTGWAIAYRPQQARVRESNVPMQCLLRKFGFAIGPEGVLRAFYREPPQKSQAVETEEVVPRYEDAYIFTYPRHDSHELQQEQVYLFHRNGR